MPSYVRPGIRKCAKNRALSLYAKVTEILNLNFNESFEIDLKYSK